jgi:hypothetical protein
MQAAVILAGLGCGALLAAVGLILWGKPRKAAGLVQAVYAIGWLAGVLLLVSALLARLAYGALTAHPSSLILVAAIAAPLGIRRREPSRDRLIPTLLALFLAGLGLVWLLASNGTRSEQNPGVSASLAMVYSWGIVICAGLGARTLGEALAKIITPHPDAEGVSPNRVDGLLNATYALLTLVVGSTALANLWQRGLAWEQTPGTSGLAGVWLVWSAAWLSPRHVPWLRAGLTIFSALVLLWVALAGI